MHKFIIFGTIIIIILSAVYSNLNTAVGTVIETEKGLFIYSPEGRYIELDSVQEIEMYRNKWKKD